MYLGQRYQTPNIFFFLGCVDHGCFLEGGQMPILSDLDNGHGDHHLASEFILRKVLVLEVADG